jgi:thymidine phosphorylase
MVKEGDIIAEVHISPNLDNSKAIDRLKNAIELSSEKIVPQPLIHDIIS